VSFTNRSSGATSFRWFFGDGTSTAKTTTRNTSHKFGTGNFYVTLNAYNSAGKLNQSIKGPVVVNCP